MSTRQEWRKRVQRWVQSGLTATEFATEAGLNVNTLRKWKYMFDQEARPLDSSERTPPSHTKGPNSTQPALPLVEVQAALVPRDPGFEVELSSGHRVRVPTTFESDALRRLLGVLEDRP